MAVSTLKIYLHDGTASFRIQLAGQMTGKDLGELSGCWRTAKSSVANRPLVVDVTLLDAVDDAGLGWFASMVDEGAQLMDGRELMVSLPKRLTGPDRETAQPTETASMSRWRSIISHIQRNIAAGPVQAK
jgi:hypothetical protein